MTPYVSGTGMLFFFIERPALRAFCQMTSDAIQVGVVTVFANIEVFLDNHYLLLTPAEMLKAPDPKKGSHRQTQIEH
jgi:hypothetical protein